MKAIVFTRYGSPDLLQLKEVARPTPNDNEVLVKVHASSINSWDWEFLNGVPFVNRLMFGLLKPKRGKQRLGADIAGTVEAAGKNVTRFKPGDAVFGDLWDNWGGFAEFACANEAALEQKPIDLTFEQAATVPQAGVLALQGLRKCEVVGPGTRVLVNGAGGGVGTFAVQIAKYYGAEVTGVDAAHKLDIIRSTGADHVLDYTETDFASTGERYDLIVDCQNFRSMFDIRRALSPDGRYAMIGGSMLRVYQLWCFSFFASLFRDGKKLSLVAEGPNKGLVDLKRLLEDGNLIPVIDRTYTLAEVPAALWYFGSGRHSGKIAITIRSDTDLSSVGRSDA